MSYDYRYNSSSHQQAFPSYHPQYMQAQSYKYNATPSGPSRYPQDSYSSNWQQQQLSTSQNIGYQQTAPVTVSPNSDSTQQKQKWRQYLKSLHTSSPRSGTTNNNDTFDDRYRSRVEANNPYDVAQQRIRFHSDPNSTSPTTSPNYNKRLPALPPPPTIRYNEAQTYSTYYDPGPSRQSLAAPPIPPRPSSMPLPNTRNNLPGPVMAYPVSEAQSKPSGKTQITKPSPPVDAEKINSVPPKSFKPSVHPHSKPRISDENRLQPPKPTTLSRPYSDSIIVTSGKGKGNTKITSRPGSKKPNPPKSRNHDSDPDWIPFIDLTLDSSSEDEDDDFNVEELTSEANVTPRSPARRKRAISEQPIHSTKSYDTPVKSRTPIKAKANTPNGAVVQCSGFTRTGQKCKRLVKASAPYLSVRDTNIIEESDERSDRIMGRYCKDHAGMICQVDGFYWKGDGSKPAIWIDFDEFLPSNLDQQTQTLLRMTMESKLTTKESPGYLYAYELRDLETPDVVYFKVGRTDNVPRRIGEWTNQCQSKTPTLRDIFPLPPPPPSSSKQFSFDFTNQGASLYRSDTLTTSFLPGATKHLNLPLKAMKRWERLVHLELSDMSTNLSDESAKAFKKSRENCIDCGLSHKEIFPLPKRQNIQPYENIVVETICRWEKFIRRITDDE
ncbi:uncharacterized protein L201_001231 [Kwoniella dendrophila CBS 6074]|uniref:Bacteriophage T5 Orf172 DNA-binding domain-containing protein n=1 Tax=Kwoniella dendrophila CBS 6074 TaxID=1295534 RepID=A0AAX4JLS6_9TREE